VLNGRVHVIPITVQRDQQGQRSGLVSWLLNEQLRMCLALHLCQTLAAELDHFLKFWHWL
jgi:hypothetical protein